MQRIAVPMIGGMVSSTVLTLIVIPADLRIDKGYRPAVGGSSTGEYLECAPSLATGV